MKRENEKEIYEVWYEYLLESNDYRKTCEWFKEVENNPELKEKTPTMQLRLMYDFFGNVTQRSFHEWWNSDPFKLSSIGLIEYRVRNI